MANVDDRGRRTAPRAAPRKPPKEFTRPVPSQVRDTKSNADRARARRASDRAIAGARRRYGQVRDTKGTADRLPEPARQKVVTGALGKLAEHVVSHPKDYRHSPLVTNLKRVGLVDTFSGYPVPSAALEAASAGPVSAGVQQALDVTARPVHGIAGGADALVQGKGLGAAHHAATRGLEGKDKTLFSDVLKHAGAPKAVQGVGGFALDVGLDPTTYLTFGAGSVARRSLEKEAARVAAKAERAGMSPEGVATVSRRAGERAAAAAAPKGSGLTVKFAGREVPGVRGGTAAVGSAGRAAAARAARIPVAGRVVQKTAGAGAVAKDLASEVRPSLRPSGVSQAEFDAGRRAARRARADVNQEMAANQSYARALQRSIGASNYERVVRAIETGTVNRLDPELLQTAVSLRSRFRHAKRLRAHAGIGEGTIRDYFPHARQDVLEAGLGISSQAVEGVRRGGGRTVARPGSAQARTDRRPIAEINPERVAAGEAPFSTNVPLVAANYLDETARAVSRANLVKSLADAGRRVRPGRDLQLKDGEAVYRLGFEPGGKSSTKLADAKGGAEVMLRAPSGRGIYGLREVDDAETQRVLAGKGRSGQYVVLDRRVVEHAVTSSRPAQAQHTSGRIFDRATGTWKRVATATPGFHVRNAIGDTQMAYLGQPGHTLPRNVGQAAKVIRRVSQQERQAKRIQTKPSRSTKTVKVAGRRVPLDDLVAGARANGVIRSGYVGRELEDLMGSGLAGAKRVRRGTGDRLKRWMQNREDLMRVATYKHGLDRGMSQGEAADLAAQIHIDYGDLTETERKYLRRAMPFYTFSARALPLHAKKLVTNPGKFATIEKAREEIGRSTGLSEDDQRAQLREYQQRQAPFVVKIGKGASAVSAALPLTMLNEIPTSTSIGDYLDELGQFGFGLLNPAAKIPAELYSNRSLFFRADIENKDRPLTAAPAWVKHIPRKYWDGLGITPDYVDKRTGKKVWAWRGKADYIAKQFPGPFNLANQLASPGTNRRGQGTVGKSVAGTSGVRVDPLDAPGAQVAIMLRDLAELNRRAGAMNQQGITADRSTPAYRKIRAEMGTLERRIDAARAEDQGAPAGAPVDARALSRARRAAARGASSGRAMDRALARARRAASR